AHGVSIRPPRRICQAARRAGKVPAWERKPPKEEVMRADRTAAILLAVFLGIVLVSALLMGGMMGGAMKPGMMYGYGGQGLAGLGGWGGGIAMGLGALMMIAFWGLVILGALFPVRTLTERRDSGPEADPLTILQR